MDEDLTCIIAILGGDKSQFRKLLVRYEHKVYGFVYKILQDHQLAEDVTQETFLAAYRNMRQFKPEKPFSTWLFSIAKHAAFKVIKERAKVDIAPEEAFNHLTSEQDEIVPQLIAKEEALLLAEAIESLAPQHVEVLTLKYFDDLSHSAISQRTGISKKKIENILYAAKLKLKGMLKNSHSSDSSNVDSQAIQGGISYVNTN